MTVNKDSFVNTYIVTWEMLHRDCRELSRRLMEQGPFKGIIAVTRGGLVPASVIARELDIRTIDSVSVSSYDWKDQGGANILKPCTATEDGDGWLVVEDLVDTGGTMRLLREMFPKAYFVAVYAKPKGRPQADMFITEVEQDTWILQPWDSELAVVPPLAKQDDEA